MQSNPDRRNGAEFDQSASDFAAPKVSLPKGGGAIRGIGEKFTTNAVTGTGSLNIPIAVSPGRSGFTPQLSLSYDSGSGNGPFGLGWSLGLPSITRKTDKGIPRYWDNEESDVFILSGAEDLVPVLRFTGRDCYVTEELEHDGYRIKQYRPRIEGLFARIERWTRLEDSDVHWRSFSKDNVLTVYGRTRESRICDPAEESHVFSWLISLSFDSKGNAISYEYASENNQGIDHAQPNERNRVRTANRYLKRVRYGNRTPQQIDNYDSSDSNWMFEIAFDYGDEDVQELAEDGQQTFVRVGEGTEADLEWPSRQDPFSTYRSGFEVRTYRLCRRVLLFHHFPDELGTSRYLVRSTEFQQHQKPTGSVLTRVVQSGYRRHSDGRYLKKSLPSMELSYTKSPLEDEAFRDYVLKEADHQDLPEGINGTNYRWLDLDGEGISGVLSEGGTGWFYKPNLGNGHFGATELLLRKPSLAALGSPHQQLMDIGGDGHLDLVEFSDGNAGFYELTPHAGWGRYRPFHSFPVENWEDPNLKFVDVTGDGIADILVTEDAAFWWHPSLLNRGFGRAIRIATPMDEEKGPRIVFADTTQSIYLADMSGGGLTDLVRIRNGEICYWPNLGYGRFGPKVSMDRSPYFDAPDLFDQRRIRLADTDGSGTTDILYLSDNGIDVYLNYCGNSWSSRRVLKDVPAGDSTTISVTDFLGHGTACLVWSSPLPADSQRPLRYLDLMCGQKPHLLTRVRNNLGAETVIEYASSTEFYLADKAAGRPWITRLSFPVHVVKRVETYDYVSRNRFTTSYSYHHGYFDGVEREFRGFAMVEQLDTERFGSTTENRAFPKADNENAAWDAPPVLTKTWYHTGVFLGADQVSRHLAQEYYHEPHESGEMLLDDTVLPAGLMSEEAREACRALKGSLLRQEVYGLDGTEDSARPYTVSENNFSIRLLQPRAGNRHSIFFTYARESLSFNYERKLYSTEGSKHPDPRITHSVTLEVDDYGNVLKSVNLAYGRRFADATDLLTPSDHFKQKQIWATLTEAEYTNAVRERDAYHNPVTARTRVYELLRLKPDAHRFGITNLFRFDELMKKVVWASDGYHDLPYEDVDGVGATEAVPYRRILQENRIYYRSNTLECLLPLKRLESLALPGEQYRQAFTPGLFTSTFQGHKIDGMSEMLPNPKAVLSREGGYVDLEQDGRWWIPAGRLFYSPDASETAASELAYAEQHFFLPHRFQDAFGNTTTVKYDTNKLLLTETLDPLGNVVQAESHYRTLAPKLVTDPNGNRTEAAFDALGMLVGTAVMGKKGERLGDSLEFFDSDLNERTILDHIGNPLQDPEQILGGATTRVLYDLFAFERSQRESQPQSAVTYTLVRETHVSDLAPGRQTKMQHSFSYSDGFGRIVQSKIQAEPGPLDKTRSIVKPRWIGSGWTIFNNKGKPVRQYEPFFSAVHQFEFAQKIGVSSTLFYDPIQRVLATLHPDHTFEKVVFDPWRQETWDVNDTVLQIDPATDRDVGNLFRQIPEQDYRPTWYEQRRSGALGQEAQEAAEKTTVHANTPGLTYFDSLGRAFLTVDQNRFEQENLKVESRYSTRIDLDIEGQQRSVTDALGRRVMAYDYDMIGLPIHQESMDAGKRWMLNDISGKPLYGWNSRGYRTRQEFDALRRPTHLYVRKGAGEESVAERALYGESEPNASEKNLRGKLFQQFDSAGVVTNESFDFKGNLLTSSRQLLDNYKNEVDWSASPTFEEQIFKASTTYDALNRVVTLSTPDSSVIRPGYDPANLLCKVDVSLRGKKTDIPFVTGVDYNAKGQRQSIQYGNQVRACYSYDPLTFRLTHLRTTRPTDATVLQDLSYTYDPIGNVSSIADRAQQTIYFKNQSVCARSNYIYDALYKTIHATGREHISSSSEHPTAWDDGPRTNQLLPNDGLAMRSYRESYEYDSVGNILKLIHSAAEGDWKRQYTYSDSEANNRLVQTRVGQLQEHYDYDANGNMTRMPHLPLMDWDFKNQLHLTEAQVVNEGLGERTYYIYDSAGQRVRKVTERQGETRTKERIYLGHFEIYREYNPSAVVKLERETLHITDDQRRIALIETKTKDQGAIEDSLPQSLVRYQLNNHLESACMELDEQAAVISYEEYYPYGSTSYEAVRNYVEVSPKRYRYCGKERDEETGFYYNSARYYAPWLARWTATDPAGTIDGLNVYEYARSNPVTCTDPNGLQSQDPLVNSGDSNDPGNYASFDDFRTGAVVSQSNDTLLEAWDKAHPPGESIQYPSDNVAFRRSGFLRTPEDTFSSVPADPDWQTNGLRAKNPTSNVTPVQHATADPVSRKSVVDPATGETVMISDSPYISVSENPNISEKQFSGELLCIDLTKASANSGYISHSELLEAARTSEPTPSDGWFKNQTEGWSEKGLGPEREGLIVNEFPPEGITPVADLPRVSNPPAVMPSTGLAGWIGRNGTTVGRAGTVFGAAASTVELYHAASQSVASNDWHPFGAEIVRQTFTWGGATTFGLAGRSIGGIVGGLGGATAGAPTGPGEVVTIPAGVVIGSFAGGIAGSIGGATLGRQLGNYVVHDRLHWQ